MLCSLAALQTLGSWTNGLTGTCRHSSLSLPDKSHPCWNVSHRIWNSLDCCVVYHDKQINQKPHWEEMWATFRKNGDEKFGLFSLLLTSQKKCHPWWFFGFLVTSAEQEEPKGFQQNLVGNVVMGPIKVWRDFRSTVPGISHTFFF